MIPSVDSIAHVQLTSLETWTVAATGPLSTTTERRDSLIFGDALVACRAKPELQCKRSGSVIFCCTRYGSHCSHLESWWPYQFSWLDVVVPEFFRAVLSHSNKIDEPAQVIADVCAARLACISVGLLKITSR